MSVELRTRYHNGLEIRSEDSEDAGSLRDFIVSDEETEPQEQVKKRRRKASVPSKAVVPYEIFGRQTEVMQLVRMLSQNTPQRPLLIGPAGIGKQSIVRKLSRFMKSDACPASLRGKRIASISCKELLGKALANEEGESEAIFFEKQMRAIMKEPSPIIYFHDIDDLALRDGAIGSIFKAFLQKPSAIIGSISEQDKCEKVEQASNALQRYNFQRFIVTEPPKDDIELILRQFIRVTPNTSHFTIDERTLKMTIDLSSTHLKQTPMPYKALQLLSEAASEASLHNRVKLTADDIAKIMSEKTGIPTEQLLAHDMGFLKRMHQSMREQLVGQDEAIKVLFKGIKRGKLGFRDPLKPWGVYLFLGSTGVGKTELAKITARVLNCNFCIFDMSEYKESHSIARLIGSPPGYVGYEAGGRLTNELRKAPHSVVLFDEMEKAHPDVANTLLQVFDDGRLTDGLGVTVDCREAIFIMTSNLGAKTVFAADAEHHDRPSLMEKLIPLIIEQWSPEFLGRITEVVPFNNLSANDYPRFVNVTLNRLAKETQDTHNIKLTWSDQVIQYLLEKHHDALTFGNRGFSEKIKLDIYNTLSEAKEADLIKKDTVKLIVKNDVLTVV